MNKSLVAFAVFIPLAFGAWTWRRVLENRLEQPQALHFKITKGNSSFVKFMPPLTDAFTLSIQNLSRYKSGCQHEEWKVERLQFRASPLQKWKTLPASSWNANWHFFRLYNYGAPINGEQVKNYGLFDYSVQRDLLVGQYRMRAPLDEEFHDNKSGVRYLGAGVFDFAFHINPAPKWKKRVILDNVLQIN